MADGIDPRALMSFRAVAEHGSFAAAARELGWTQPALSSQVRRLEESLGVTLVTRTVKGVQLTEPGRRLLHHAEIIDGHLERAAREVAGLVDEGQRTVRVVAFPSACTSIVASAMSELLARGSAGEPGTAIELEQQEPFAVPELLRRGTADVALVFRYEGEASPDFGAEVTEIPIGWDPLQLIVSQRRGSTGTKRRPLAEHARDRWVTGCPACRQHFLRIAEREGFVPDIRHATDDYMVVQELVARDMSVSVVPRLSLLSYRHPGVRAFGIGEGDGRQLLIVHAKGEVRQEVHDVVAALERAAARVLDPVELGARPGVGESA
ncbi:LysR family transcriptional regulator [Leucobacter chromiireducens]|uniref:LysR family transcriptional regulator n=1 Tax=Leucobacter chromiireducens subsp. chromiireducens TaxID=660067 RepID=A0ABS1SNA5_9MICO|nr:LysR family transcriptional regulator [Leucobacter chromiireducens]MBL3689652.1 LysR family transcriptional regulator [Leucobacter chromiireducens subsp. chromiireducens]